MQNRRNKTSSNNSYNLDEEINIKNYPYYRYIPIKTISEKQKKYIDKYINVQEPVNYQTENPIMTNPASISQPESPIENIKTHNKSENETIEQQTDIIIMNENIQKNSEKIYEQQQTINANDQLIREQTSLISINKELLSKQVVTYNNNMAVLLSQYNQMNILNAEISKLNQNIDGLNEQVKIVQEELEETNIEKEEVQNQLNYHISMLNSYNMLIQNPQYFMQLMSLSLGYTK